MQSPEILVEGLFVQKKGLSGHFLDIYGHICCFPEVSGQKCLEKLFLQWATEVYLYIKVSRSTNLPKQINIDKTKVFFLLKISPSSHKNLESKVRDLEYILRFRETLSKKQLYSAFFLTIFWYFSISLVMFKTMQGK